MSETKLYIKNGESYEEVDGVLQKDVDNIVEYRMARERKKYSDYDDLKKQVETLSKSKTDAEAKLAESSTRIKDLESNIKKAENETTRVKLATEYKLPNDLQEFITGDTAEEMRARAEKLSKGATGGKVPITKHEKPEKKETDTATIAKGLFGQKSDD